MFWPPVGSEGGEPAALVEGFSPGFAFDLGVVEGDDARRDAEAILGGGREGGRKGRKEGGKDSTWPICFSKEEECK